MSKIQSIPVKLMHEGEGHVVTVELKNGEIYRGLLNESEETMNCQMSNVTMTGKDGRLSKLEQIYLRGSQIKFMVLPDMLKNAPMFKKVQALKKPETEKKGGGGRGKKRTGGRK